MIFSLELGSAGDSIASIIRRYNWWVGHRYVRQLLDRGVAADKIENFARHFERTEYLIDVPLATANALDIFAENAVVKVEVPHESLNRFVKVEAVEENGKWHFEYRVDNDAVLAAWIAAGCPVRWDPSRE